MSLRAILPQLAPTSHPRGQKIGQIGQKIVGPSRKIRAQTQKTGFTTSRLLQDNRQGTNKDKSVQAERLTRLEQSSPFSGTTEA
jgi:hypothetical protein